MKKMILEKGSRHSLKFSGNNKNTATTEASKELKDQTNKVASQKNIKITILLFLYMDLMVMHQELVPLQEKVTIGVVTVSKLFKIIELKVIM